MLDWAEVRGGPHRADTPRVAAPGEAGSHLQQGWYKEGQACRGPPRVRLPAGHSLTGDDCGVGKWTPSEINPGVPDA